jgi:hypothetical protein
MELVDEPTPKELGSKPNAGSNKRNALLLEPANEITSARSLARFG